MLDHSKAPVINLLYKIGSALDQGQYNLLRVSHVGIRVW